MSKNFVDQFANIFFNFVSLFLSFFSCVRQLLNDFEKYGCKIHAKKIHFVLKKISVICNYVRKALLVVDYGRCSKVTSVVRLQSLNGIKFVLDNTHNSMVIIKFIYSQIGKRPKTSRSKQVTSQAEVGLN